MFCLNVTVAGDKECLLNSTLYTGIPWAIQMLRARKCSEALQDAVSDWQSDHVILGALGTSGEGCGGTDRTVRRMLADCERFRRWLLSAEARVHCRDDSYEVHGGNSDSGAGLCPISLSFSLVMATPPLLCNHPSLRDSPEDGASHRVLVLVGSFISGHRVSIKQWLTPKELKPNLFIVGSNLGPQSGYSDRRFWRLLPIHSDECYHSS